MRLLALAIVAAAAAPVQARRMSEPGYVSGFIDTVSAAVRTVAPEFGLRERPTDAFVTSHAAISSGWGRSTLAAKHYNLFGIKAGPTWTGPTVDLMTTDYSKAGVPTTHVQRWRVYAGYEACIRDHLRLVMTTPRYAASAKLLRASSLDYMAQMGRDGWYSSSQVGHVSAEWKAGVRRVLKYQGIRLLSGAGVATWAIGGALLAWALS